MSDEEGKVAGEKKSSKHRKIMTIVIVIILIQVSFIAIWYVYLRPWTIRDLAAATNVDFDEENWDFYPHSEGGQSSPGFSDNIAGKNRMVKGIITGIKAYMTTQGPITYYELDDFKYIHKIEWNLPRYEIGDEIEKKVYFEWGHWNNDRNVCSPQVDFPALGATSAIERIINRVSLVHGLILLANQTETGGPINVSVIMPRGEGFPLALFNCSLRMGVDSGIADNIAVWGGYREYPILDTISFLTTQSGENDVIHFSDANHNGLLDDGDFFILYVTGPEDDNAIQTYFFSINDFLISYTNRIVSGGCYIVMTNMGILRHLSCISDRNEMGRYLMTRVIEEEENAMNITISITITNVVGEAPLLSDSYCNLFLETDDFQEIELEEGEILNENGIEIEFSDSNNNELLDTGDLIIITGLNNRSECEFGLGWEYWEDDIPIRGRCSDLHWTTGIGTNTGYVPVIQFGEQNITDTNQNRTLIIDIERMYGVPGLNLSQEEPYIWFRTHLERDDQEVFITNLTLDFEVNIDEFNITFLDADANEFINTGDSFIFEGNPGSYRLILDYVQRDREEEEGFRLLHSQSFSWTI